MQRTLSRMAAALASCYANARMLLSSSKTFKTTILPPSPHLPHNTTAIRNPTHFRPGTQSHSYLSTSQAGKTQTLPETCANAGNGRFASRFAIADRAVAAAQPLPSLASLSSFQNFRPPTALPTLPPLGCGGVRRLQLPAALWRNGARSAVLSCPTCLQRPDVRRRPPRGLHSLPGPLLAPRPAVPLVAVPVPVPAPPLPLLVVL